MKNKNIWLLPTDKPSRLYYNTELPNNFIHNANNFPLHEDLVRDKFQSHNIYITNDEEIKDGDYVKNISIDEPIFKLESSNFYYATLVPYFKFKKIILTTDIDLIKDGVQPIDDEFLEWFVKNPSCERIEVVRNKKLSNKSIYDAVKGDLVFNNHNCGGIIESLSDDIRVHITSENGEGYMETAITSDNGIDTLIINNYKIYEYSDYKIIIPKEETLEQIAERILNKNEVDDGDMILSCTFPNTIKSMVEMAKFQQEQDKNKYSEEDVLKILSKFRELPLIQFQEWFEQFKNK